MLRSLIILVLVVSTCCTGFAQNRIGMELKPIITVELVDSTGNTQTNQPETHPAVKLLSPFADEKALKTEYYVTSSQHLDADRKEVVISVIPLL